MTVSELIKELVGCGVTAEDVRKARDDVALVTDNEAIAAACTDEAFAASDSVPVMEALTICYSRDHGRDARIARDARRAIPMPHVRGSEHS